MRQTITYKRLKQDTINGDSIQVTMVYSSFDKNEIDSVEEVFKETIGTGIISEFETKFGKDNE